ncbi:unnamed protein product [Fusarium graminearum]|uniref:Chromosome 3, complete genome n=1 Tax=Gibberella zeae (strain ATCC MYA-4620 / CBS 123657 / FGSC 9075 / NRRL 31084 / PH-1) TaxID=229533 RepID=A0A098DWB2_GIBZE|nr:unnamed protein product [Fusarium graminearum]CZS83486.1 unnamed protein product [Fusarium graminearum]
MYCFPAAHTRFNGIQSENLFFEDDQADHSSSTTDYVFNSIFIGGTPKPRRDVGKLARASKRSSRPAPSSIWLHTDTPIPFATEHPR